MNGDRRSFLQAGGGALAGSLLLSFKNAQRQFLDSIQQADFVSDSLVDAHQLRKQYSLDPNIAYLNHASIGAIPIPVQNARNQYLQICEQNPWLYMWGGEWEQPREEVRQLAATLLGCDTNEIAFTHNTTELFNTLANGLPLKDGDEVLFSSLNHDGASVAFEHAAKRRGFTARRFDFPLEESTDLNSDRVTEIYAQQITPATRLLVFPHIDNTIGVQYPVKRMAEMARRKGVQYIAVDGAQSVGTINVNSNQSGVDVYSTSGHKWLGAPKGTGLGFVSQQIQAELEPMWVTWGQKRWKDSARCYEDYGTRNLAEILALGDAIQFHSKINNDTREKRLLEIRSHIKNRVAKIDSLQFNSPIDNELASAVVSISLQQANAGEVAKRLFEKHQVVVRPFKAKNINAIRVSPNVYTTFEEIDKLLEILKAI